MKKILKSAVIILVLGAISVQATLSAFTTNGKVLGNSFSTGHANLFLLQNLALPATPENLSTVIPGSTFDDITPNWKKAVGVKLVNNGTVPLNTVLAAHLIDTQGNGGGNLNDVLQVKAYQWADNGDGIIQESEYRSSMETKTFEYWFTSPYTLGTLPPGQVFPLILEFFVNDLGNQYQNAGTNVDFVFDATAIN